MIIAEYMSSSFYGGPERQTVRLYRHLPDDRVTFLLLDEGGRQRPLADKAVASGFDSVVLKENTPRYPSMVRELAGHLERLGADVLCTHGYKTDLVGLAAARRVGVPIVAVVHGWTAASWKVRVYEAAGRLGLRRMDRVICVSEGQAAKVRRAGVAGPKIVVIHNAVDVNATPQAEPAARAELLSLFGGAPPLRVVGAAGRLSPEKGFGVLVEAAAQVVRADPTIGFVHFGDGPLLESIRSRVEALGLAHRFILGGFRDDLQRLVPCWDLAVLPSFTEGLPNVALEATAACVPIVATAVGGTPEVVLDGENGRLVPPGDPDALGLAIRDVLGLADGGRALGLRGREIMRERFTYQAKADRFRAVFEEAAAAKRRPGSARPPEDAPR
jgi:glycosyltransferase involved in cell wall biosynthesis